MCPKGFTELQAHDYNGLTNLYSMYLTYDDFDSLPEGIFDENPNLRKYRPEQQPVEFVAGWSLCQQH